VVGQDLPAEAVMGFFTKFGDGACDLARLTGLTKAGAQLAAELGAPATLVKKVAHGRSGGAETRQTRMKMPTA